MKDLQCTFTTSLKCNPSLRPSGKARETLLPCSPLGGGAKRRMIFHTNSPQWTVCLSVSTKLRDFPENQRPKTNWRDRPLGRLRETVGYFFPQINKRRHSVSLTRRARASRPTGVGFQPRSRPFRSLTVHAYLATRKYRLACVCSLSSGSAYHIILSSWRSRALYHNTAKTQGWRRSTPSPCVPLYGFEFASMSGS